MTNGWYHDVSPSFDPDGQHLYLLSFREFDPVADSQYFGYGFPRGMRPYLITLASDSSDPFRPDPRPLRSPPRAERGAVEIDLDGLGDRLVPFPVPEGRYEQIVGVGSGQVLLTRAPVRGLLDRTWYDPGPPKADAQLLMWEFDKQELVELNPRVSGFRVDRKRRSPRDPVGARLRVVQSRPDKSQRDEIRKTEGRADRKSGWIDLGRVRVSVDPGVEWSQILREAWRLMRDHYWNPEMNGVDWAAVWDRYLPLVRPGRVPRRALRPGVVHAGRARHQPRLRDGRGLRSAPNWPDGRLGADSCGGPASRRLAGSRGSAGESPATPMELAAPGSGRRAARGRRRCPRRRGAGRRRHTAGGPAGQPGRRRSCRVASSGAG